ncbi:MAG TPA: low molecular weight protein-tyrosine-phosphatase [Burkholderiaceae bacterium]|nr:low molecular weight protein-tyrosine-phosphatase [Burkholderiaceae bacterium]
MVCLGNICRSPTAEAVLRHKLAAAGLDGHVEVDSAGTGDWHVGDPPDARSQRHAARRGYDLSALRGRRVSEADFERFDLILAMDEDNLADLERLRPDGGRAELRLFAGRPVPDPYAGGPAGFEQVLDLVEAASEVLARDLARRLGTS